MGKIAVLLTSVVAFTAGTYVGIAHRDMVLSYAQRWEPQTTAITKTLKTKTKETLANIKNEPAPKRDLARDLAQKMDLVEIVEGTETAVGTTKQVNGIQFYGYPYYQSSQYTIRVDNTAQMYKSCLGNPLLSKTDGILVFATTDKDQFDEAVKEIESYTKRRLVQFSFTDGKVYLFVANLANDTTFEENSVVIGPLDGAEEETTKTLAGHFKELYGLREINK